MIVVLSVGLCCLSSIMFAAICCSMWRLTVVFISVVNRSAACWSCRCSSVVGCGGFILFVSSVMFRCIFAGVVCQFW